MNRNDQVIVILAAAVSACVVIIRSFLALAAHEFDAGFLLTTMVSGVGAFSAAGVYFSYFFWHLGIDFVKLDRPSDEPGTEIIMQLMPEIKPPGPDIGAAVAFLKKLIIEDLWKRKQD